MINKYEDFSAVKKEINKFIDIINIKSEKNELIHMTKMLLFLKQLRESLEDTYYYDCMFSDALQMINLLTRNSKRLVYMVYRSLIENSIRFLLQLNLNDETGVNQLFRQFQELCGEESKDVYAFINGEYSTGCNYAHSNISADMNLYEYYSDIAIDKVEVEEIKKLFQKEIKYLKNIIDIIITKNPRLIDEAFYRENQKLKFLLSDKVYDEYKQMVSNI